MKRSTTRWMTTVAAATVIALPVSGFAQTPPAAPAQQVTTPASPPATQDEAKTHLTAARNSLSQLTALPAAAKLEGDARTQVTQLIANFNELITTQTDWKSAYLKIESNLNALLGTEAADPARMATAGTAGAVGTSGKTGELDPAVRAKLTEMKGHLDKFEVAAEAAPKAEAIAPPMGTPAPATTITGNPPATPVASATATSTTTSTEVTTRTTPPAATAGAPAPAGQPASASQPMSTQPVTVTPRDVLLHVEAIEVILGAQAAANQAAQSAAGGLVKSSPTPSGSTRNTITSADLTLNSAQLEQLRNHLSEIRKALEKK